MLTAVSDSTEAAIWERVIHPQGSMTPSAARRIVQMTFSEAEKVRMHELAVKNQAGALTPQEQAELDNYCRVGVTLSVLQSRARQVLKSRRRVS